MSTWENCELKKLKTILVLKLKKQSNFVIIKKLVLCVTQIISVTKSRKKIFLNHQVGSAMCYKHITIEEGSCIKKVWSKGSFINSDCKILLLKSYYDI